MGPGAVGAALEERGAVARSRSLHRLIGGRMDGDEIVAIQLHAGEAVGGGAAADLRNAAGVAEGNFRRKAVVFADEQHRQLPDRCHVEPLVEGGIIDGAIAEEGDRYGAVAAQLGGIPSTAGLENAGADDAAGAHHPDLGGKQVHRATAATRAASRAAKQLGAEVGRGHALGKGMAMATVGAEDRVAGAQMPTDADGHRLLADIRVAGAMDEPARVAAGELLFGETDDEHRPVAVEEDVDIRGSGRGRHQGGQTRGGGQGRAVNGRATKSRRRR